MKFKLVSALSIILLMQPFKVICQDSTLIDTEAKLVYQFCLNNEFNEVVSYFDQQLIYRLNATKLSKTWELLQEQLGKVKMIDPPESYQEQIDSMVYVYRLLQFEKKEVDLKLEFNSENKITAFNFSPTSLRYSYKTPSWVLPGQVKEQDILIPSSDLRLKGKLSIPANGEKFPVIILVGGIGPQDMDLQIGGNRIFKDLAVELAAKGFAVIRFDNRSKAYLTELKNSLPYLTPDEEIVQDALAVIDYAKVNEHINSDKIVVLGFGIGGMMAPRIAHYSSSVKGVITLAANATPVHEMELRKLKYLAAHDSSYVNAFAEMNVKVERIRKGDYVDSTYLEFLPLGRGGFFWRYLDTYDQFNEAIECKVPMLMLQGERDFEVTMDDFKLWQTKLKDRPETTFKSFPQLNHLFLWGKGSSYPLEYNKQSNVSKPVIDEIAEWMQRIFK